MPTRPRDKIVDMLKNATIDQVPTSFLIDLRKAVITEINRRRGEAKMDRQEFAKNASRGKC